MIPFDSDANYYEIYISNAASGGGGQAGAKVDGPDGHKSYDIGLSRKDFRNLLSTIAKSNLNLKPFQKEYKEYIYDDVIVHNYKNTETHVFRHTPICIKQLDKTCGALLIGYQKNKLTFLNVPSTRNIYDIQYVKKLIFRVNNRIFVNFQSSVNLNQEKTYTAYINYNHENNIEQDSVQNNIESLMKVLSLS